MIIQSQRDVVFTPLMLRVREAAAGIDVRARLRLTASRLRSVGTATDDWVGQRARAEQVIAEANAMLTGTTEVIDLEDRIGEDLLGFTLSRLDRTAEITLRLVDRQAWLELTRSWAPVAGPVELVDQQVLEDLVIELVLHGTDHG